MPRYRKTAVVGLVLVPLLAGGFMLQERSTQDGARLFDQVLSLVSSRFVDTVDAAGLYEKAARGLVHELNDPYTVLFTPKEAQSFQTTTGGRYAGIGMQIENIKGQITVNKVFPNTPAEEAGIVEGDRIVAIDTASTRGWDTEKVSNTLKGNPGTKVSVKFIRPGVDDTVRVKFTRAVIHIPAVRYALMLDNKVGYIPVDQFNETATDEVESAVRRLTSQGARGIILDMRDNPGGILDQALAMSNLFLKQDQQIASVRSRSGDDQTYLAKERPLAPTIPLVVMTDGGAASASEIVAGSLQDHDRALVVGTTSFGKGLVQTLFPLDGGYYLKMTTAKWYTPSGRSIQKERKFVDGKFVEEAAPDSLEGDSVKKTRPMFKSDAGRTVYGGGGITPDVIVKPDTLSTVEQQVGKAIFAKLQESYAILANYAVELKPSITSPNFVVQPAWREEFYKRLQGVGVAIDRKQYDAATPYVDRLLGNRIAKLVYGDSAVKRREFNSNDDLQLRKAVDILQKGQTQQDLFTIAQRQQQTAAVAPHQEPSPITRKNP
jgi:carboxyl-terminal processing protease